MGVPREAGPGMGNMRMTIRGWMAAAVAVSLSGLGGCLGDRMAGSTGVGNPPRSALSFTMVADKGAAAAKLAAPSARTRDADTAYPVVDRSGTAFVLRRALANVGQVKLKLPDGVKCTPALAQDCEADELKVPGPFLADLMAGTFTPAFPTIQAPHGDYRRVDVRLEALEPGRTAADTALVGHSMLLSGTFTYAGRSDRAFEIVLDFNEEARFDSGSSRVREAPLNLLKLRMDVDHWLAESGIGACLDSGSLILHGAGDLRIDKDNACDGLEQAIKNGVKASGTLEDAP